jgi:hypothetical protein
LLTILVCV